MADSPLLTIVVTTHYRPGQLVSALKSIREQGDLPVEIILCDDAGGAETRHVAADMLSDRDILISRPGMRGPAESRNFGIELARAPWIGFLDDDDRLAPGWLARLFPELRDPTPRVLFGDFMLCNTHAAGPSGRSDGSPGQRIDTGAAPVFSLRVRNMIHSAAFVMPRTVSARFDPALRSHEDWDFLLALHAEIPFQHLSVVASEYYAAPAGNRNSVSARTLAADYLAIYERHPTMELPMQLARVEWLRQLGGMASGAEG
ncbi:MAG: glycosyltransferase family 2 protein [Paracoccus sp. (in: a-proteobacteria)]